MARSPTPLGGRILPTELHARYRQCCGSVEARRWQALWLMWLLVVGSVMSWGLPVQAQEHERPAAETRRGEEDEERQAAAARQTGEMVSVPGGAFYMGCNETVDTECDEDEKPGRQVLVNAFMMDKTEVTVARFGQCVDAGV